MPDLDWTDAALDRLAELVTALQPRDLVVYRDPSPLVKRLHHGHHCIVLAAPSPHLSGQVPLWDTDFGGIGQMFYADPAHCHLVQPATQLPATTRLAIDPPGCGCTECITGQYVPLDQASPHEIAAARAGLIADNTSGALAAMKETAA